MGRLPIWIYQFGSLGIDLDGPIRLQNPSVVVFKRLNNQIRRAWYSTANSIIEKVHSSRNNDEVNINWLALGIVWAGPMCEILHNLDPA